MLLIRRFEEKAGQLYGMGLIGGFCHLYIGQEAVVVGMQMAHRATATRSSPATATTATCWPAAWTRKGVMAELTGRAGGYSKGKGGSMHMFSVEKGFYGGHGIVGAQVPLGTGLPSPTTTAATSNVCAHLFRRRRGQPGPGLRELQHGGAVEAAGRSTSSRTTSTPWAPRSSAPRRRPTSPSAALSFDIPGEQVDGMDVRAVQGRRRARPSRTCRAGKGPYILEMKTYRYRGHSMSDPAKYRTREEVDEDAQGARPDRARARKRLLETKRRDEDDLKAIDAEVKRDRRTTPPNSRTQRSRAGPAELWTDVLAGAPELDDIMPIDSDARPVAHHGGGQARQVAEGKATRSRPAT